MLVPSCMSWPSEKENKTVDKSCFIAVYMSTLCPMPGCCYRIRMPYPYANPYACERHLIRHLWWFQIEKSLWSPWFIQKYFSDVFVKSDWIFAPSESFHTTVQCWADVVDGGPTLNQHWVNVFAELVSLFKKTSVFWDIVCQSSHIWKVPTSPIHHNINEM